MKLTNFLLAVICIVLIAGLSLYAYPKYEQWETIREAAKAAHADAELEKTRRAIHAFSAECKGRETETDCRIVGP